jgi:hypothetical protein
MKRKPTLPITLLIFICLFFFPAICTSQKDYIITDTTTNFGIQLVDASEVFNGQFIQQFIRDTILRFTPRDCKEYGFEDGRVYVRKSIASPDTQQIVFLQRLANGKATLYYFNAGHSKSYFLEKDNGPLVQLLIPEGTQQISQLPEAILNLTSDCQDFSEMAEDANYKKKSFIQLIQRYNHCDIRPFPHFRYGIQAGTALSKIDPDLATLAAAPLPLTFDLELAWLWGAFIDIPLKAGPFSIHVAAQYHDLHYRTGGSTGNEEFDFVVNATSIQLPTTFRYTFISRKWKPFLEAGAVLCYNFKHENIIYHSTATGPHVEIQTPIEPGWIGKTRAGYLLGLGIEYAIHLHHSIFFETRYMNQYNLQGSSGSTNADFQFTLGYNF